MYDVDGFTFFKSYYNAIKNMKTKEGDQFTRAILEYVFEGKEPNFKGNIAVNWELVKPNLVKSKNKSHRKQNKTKQNQIEIK